MINVYSIVHAIICDHYSVVSLSLPGNILSPAMALPRRRSLSERLRHLFGRRSRSEHKTRRMCLFQDIDEEPQRHMLETERQVAEAITSHGVYSRGVKHAGTDLPGDMGTDKHSDRNLQSPKEVEKSAEWGPSTGNSEQPVTESARHEVPPTVHVSPLDMFYHTYVAPFDHRITRPHADLEGVALSTATRQAFGKRPSKDNTTGSIDSIDSEEELFVESVEEAIPEKFVTAHVYAKNTKERQFIEAAAKRSGKGKTHRSRERNLLRSGGYRQKFHHETLDQDESLLVESGPSEQVVRSASNVDNGNHSPTWSQENIEFLPMQPDEGNIERTKDRSIPPSLEEDEGLKSVSSDTLEMSMDTEQYMSGFVSPCQAETGIRIDMRIDNAVLNMKRTNDRIKASSKYSQVVIIRERDQNVEISPRTFETASTSTDVRELTDPMAELARHASFNICGENVYITMGSKKTKIKTSRKNRDFTGSSGKRIGKLKQKKGKKNAKGPAKKGGKKTNMKKGAVVKESPSEVIVEMETAIIANGGDTVDVVGSVPGTHNTKDTLEKEGTRVGRSVMVTPKCVNIDDKNLQDVTFENAVDAKRCALPESEETRQVRSTEPTLSGQSCADPVDAQIAVREESACAIHSQPVTTVSSLHSTVANYGSSASKEDLTPDEAMCREEAGLEACTNMIMVEELVELSPECGPDGDSMSQLEHFDGWVLVSLESAGAVNHQSAEVDPDLAQLNILPSAQEILISAGRAATRDTTMLDDYTTCEIKRRIETVATCQGPSSEPDDPITVFVESRGHVSQAEDIDIVSRCNADAHLMWRTSESRSSGLVDGRSYEPANLMSMPHPVREEEERNVCVARNNGDEHGSSEADSWSRHAGNHQQDNGDQDDHGTHSALVIDDTGMVDIFALKQVWRAESRNLKKLISKHRFRTERVRRLQQFIAQLKMEAGEMTRLVRGLDSQTAALRKEASDLRCTLSAIADVSASGLAKETDARTLEPTCFRRYTNIRTPLDAANLLSSIRDRLKALGELEVLTYKKQLVLNHILPGPAQDRGAVPKRVVRPQHKGQKLKKNDDSANKKGNIVIEVVSPSPEPGAATPSWSAEEVTNNTESPVTASTPLSASRDGGTPPIFPPDPTDL